MKKICLLLLCVICCLSIISCDTNTLSNMNGEHQHEWSALACGSNQKCLTCGEEKAEVTDHKWSEAVCGQKQICLICGKAQEHKIEHEWSEAICGQKQTCLKCNEQSENIVPHTTERGVCERCGVEYVSKENQIADENARHEKALADLESQYSALYDSHYNEYVQYSSMVTVSESYVNSRLISLISIISELEFDVTMASLDKSYSGQLKYNRLSQELAEAKLEQSNLQQEQSYYNRINSSYESMNAVQNQYNSKVAQENALHEENLAKINEE